MIDDLGHPAGVKLQPNLSVTHVVRSAQGIWRRRFRTFVIAAFWVAFTAGAQEVTLRGKITEGVTGLPAACTVAITDSNGKLLLENDSFRAGFRCSGEFMKRLPPGRTRIRIIRGFETPLVETELNLEAGQEMDLKLVLQRTVDLRKRGWYSGDSHVHMLHGERTVPVTFDFVALTARAEDLQYMSLAQAWDLKNPTPEALQTELRRHSTTNCVLSWNLEAPKNYYKGDAGRCLGHCWNLGLRGRATGGADVIQVLLDASAWDYESQKPSYANFESHRLIHDQGGAVFYTHPARWWTGPWGGQGGYPKVEQMRVSNIAVELPLDTVVGPSFDGVDVITGPGELEANEKAFQIWSMLLNHRYRLTATGSSDACFDRPGGAAPGVPRLYSYVPDGFSIEKVTRATAAGRTFVTTGPLLLATLDNEPPGSVFRTGNKNHVLSVEAWAGGNCPDGLERLEVLRNGQPWRECVLSNQLAFVRTNFVFEETQPSWYCVRLWQGASKKKVAITSAFYFEQTPTRPTPAQAQVRARIVDAQSGALVPGTITEVVYAGTLSHDGKRHALRSGEGQLGIPGTSRLRADAKGYKSQVLSPFLDNPALLRQVTNLEDKDLLDWETFEKMRQELSNVELEFRLERKNR